jgi:hypothetical protein
MKGFKRLLFCVLLLGTGVFAASNGEVQLQDGKQKAWHEQTQQWLSLEGFWRAYAKEKGGLTWKEGKEYPPYNQVKEFDLFMVKLDSGVCLMEFFHERWRRAQDVRRWDEKFNEYGACPDVFK